MDQWTEIVRAHSEAVYRVAVRILGDAHEAEDVSQDVFAEAFRLLSAKEVRDWCGMLMRMSTLRSIDRLRKRRQASELDDSHAAHASPDEPAIARELATQLRSLMSRLPQQQAAVFSLTHFEGMSRQEVAQSLGISPQAVSTALHKARQFLETKLRKNEVLK